VKRNRILNQIGVIFVTCLFILLSSQIAIAATYYIDYVNGLDSNNGTTTSKPWKFAPEMPGFTGTYSHSAGDVFVFKGGVTWPMQSGHTNVLSISNSGSSGSPDVYMGGQQCGYTPPSPFLLNGTSACNGTNYPCGSNASVSCNGGVAWGIGYPHFDGGAINWAMVIHMNAELSYVIIDGIEIDNAGYTDGSGQGIYANTTSSLEVKNNILNTNAVNAFFHGIGFNKAHIYFHDNLIENSGRVVINTTDLTFYMDDVQLYNNIFLGLGTYNPHTFHSDGFMVGANVTPANGNWMTNLYIHHNIFRGNFRGTGAIYLNGTSTTNDINGAWIYDNVIAPETNDCSAIAFSPAAIAVYGGYQHNINIFNNTISGDNCPSLPFSGISLSNVTGNATVENNIISGTDNAVVIDSSCTGTITIDYNIYNTVTNDHLIYDNRAGQSRCNSIANCQAQGEEAHGIANTNYSSSYMKFVTLPSGGVTGSGNWQLQSNSPAIGVGNNLSSYFTTDYLGNTRQVPWVIGAYEYGADSLNALRSSTGAEINTSSAADDGDKGKSGCFIATAAYGSYLDPHVMVLREFRDKVLLKTKLGQKFVKFYYKHSPPVADFIRKVEALRVATRLALTPMVYALAYPNATAMLLLTVLLILMIGRRKKMEKLVYSMGSTYFQSGPRKAFVKVR
jgi:hypothetical protein